MLTIEQLLAILERSLLVAPEQIERLRRLNQTSPDEFNPRVAMKWLVHHQYLTEQQAARLLAGEAKSLAEPVAPANVDHEVEDEIELLPLDDPKPGKPQPIPPQPAAAPPSAASQSAALPPLNPLLDELLDDPTFKKAPANRPIGLKSTGGGPAQPKPRRNVWDSPLLIGGGGLLVLLCLAGGVLFWSLNRQTGEQALAQAEDDYRSGSYSQAIHKYDQFLEKFSGHPGASVARVHRGLAQLRQAVDGTSDWPRALQRAKDVLGQIAREESFGEASTDLAALLPTIAEGLARLAVAHPEATVVAQANEALAMIHKYVAPTLRPTQKLANIEASLALASRKLDQENSLQTALASIRQSLAAGRAAEAYATEKQLLKMYPELATSDSLRSVLVEITGAERGIVKFVRESVAAEKDEPASPLLAALTLAHRKPGAAASTQNDVVFTLADGALFALDAGSGKLLWRRFVGFDTQFVPSPVAGKEASVVLVDSLRRELVCVTAGDGKLRWRAPVGEPFSADPLVVRRQILVAARSGKLVVLDVDTGARVGHFKLPQTLVPRPATDARERLYYQLAEHSSLFVLSAKDQTCPEVLYLGHRAGSVRVPPVMLGRMLLVAENRTPEGGILHVIETGEEGLGLKPVQQIRYAGQLLSAPEMLGRTVFFATDRGALYAYELTEANQENPLAMLVDKPAENTSPVIHYLLAREGRLFLAARGLTQYDAQTSRGRLVPNWINHAGDLFLSMPQLVGRRLLVETRRVAKLPGVAVAGVSPDDGKVLWETQLAAPLAGLVASDDDHEKVMALTVDGAWFDLDAKDLKGYVTQDAPSGFENLAEPISGVPIALKSGEWAMVVGAPGSAKRDRQLLLVDPKSNKKRWLPLPDVLAAAPITFGEGLLVPCRVGQVFCLDPGDGKNQLEPFQPRLEAGTLFAWSSPARLGEMEALISDGRTKLYRIGIEARPKPHLVALAEATLAEPTASRIAVLEKTAYVADSGGRLLSFALPDLMPGKDWPLGSPPVWGPIRAGDCVLVVSAKGDLLCVDDQQSLRWEVALPYGPLTGNPLVAGETILLTSVSGVVYRIDAATGAQRAKLDVEQPLAGSPLLLGDRLLLPGRDGTVLIVESPR
jgi:outer membrane protein assembly factor BamB